MGGAHVPGCEGGSRGPQGPAPIPSPEGLAGACQASRGTLWRGSPQLTVPGAEDVDGWKEGGAPEKDRPPRSRGPRSSPWPHPPPEKVPGPASLAQGVLAVSPCDLPQAFPVPALSHSVPPGLALPAAGTAASFVHGWRTRLHQPPCVSPAGRLSPGVPGVVSACQGLGHHVCSAGVGLD